MEFQVDRKQEILNALNKRHSENRITQSYLLDMNQELNRCNHIMKHILRSQYNYEGRLVGSAMFGTVALLFCLDKQSSLKKFSSRNLALTLTSTIAFSLFGFYYFGARRFGDIGDYRKNQKIYDESLKIDKDFRDIMKNFKA
jgi:hypothetical protein